jgi:hypothetical protein
MPESELATRLPAAAGLPSQRTGHDVAELAR